MRSCIRESRNEAMKRLVQSVSDAAITRSDAPLRQYHSIRFSECQCIHSLCSLSLSSNFRTFSPTADNNLVGTRQPICTARIKKSEISNAQFDVLKITRHGSERRSPNEIEYNDNRHRDATATNLFIYFRWFYAINSIMSCCTLRFTLLNSQQILRVCLHSQFPLA